METIIKREIIYDKKICRMLAVGAFISFTALSAFIRIPLPFTPVPLTLQTFFVLLSGALLGRKLGALTQIAYMFLGLTGLSVFTGTGAGALYLFGPTGGYIIGFILAALVAGSLFEKQEKNQIAVFLKLLSADFVILACGMLWLKISLSIPLSRAFLIGFLPFIFGDALKAALAATIYNAIYSRSKAVLY